MLHGVPNEVPFEVVAEGVFEKPYLWVIYCEIRFRMDVSSKERQEWAPFCRHVLSIFVANKAQHGRRLGASEIRLQMDPMTRAWVGPLVEDLSPVQ